MNLNKVFIIGRLTADPQLRTTPSGQSVTTLSVATNRFWTDKSGARQEKTEFHSIVVWGRQAEVANQFLTKGGLVYVEGRLATRSWQDKQGVERKVTEIISERLQLGPRSSTAGVAAAVGKEKDAFDSTASNSPAAASSSPVEELPIIDIEEGAKEDLPF